VENFRTCFKPMNVMLIAPEQGSPPGISAQLVEVRKADLIKEHGIAPLPLIPGGNDGGAPVSVTDDDGVEEVWGQVWLVAEHE